MDRMNQLAYPVSQPPSYIQSPGPLNPPALGNGTYTSWPGGVDPSVKLYAGNPVPLSMTGGRRSSRKNYRKNSRKNNRRAPCGSRKNNRRSSRKNNRKASRKH